VKTPTSNSEPAPQRGFTLLELMMVLLLLGLLVGAGLTLDFSGSPSSQRQVATQLAGQLQLAALEAVQSGNEWGLDFFMRTTADGNNASGYRWLWHDGKRWQNADPALLHASAADYLLPAELEWQLTVDGSTLQPEPQQALATTNGAANPRFRPEILLSPQREGTPFSLQLCARGHQSCTTAIDVDELGRVTVRDGDAQR